MRRARRWPRAGLVALTVALALQGAPFGVAAAAAPAPQHGTPGRATGIHLKQHVAAVRDLPRPAEQASQRQQPVHPEHHPDPRRIVGPTTRPFTTPFRYDAAIAGYIVNLPTRGLAAGGYNLEFTTSSADTTTHLAPFTIR
ncbi:hypothetical protein ACPC54_40810 [Kitasatospora sp. NPDC094028]